jgi:hypothetical protein
LIDDLKKKVAPAQVAEAIGAEVLSAPILASASECNLKERQAEIGSLVRSVSSQFTYRVCQRSSQPYQIDCRTELELCGKSKS